MTTRTEQLKNAIPEAPTSDGPTPGAKALMRKPDRKSVV